jgi:hypothetical protein
MRTARDFAAENIADAEVVTDDEDAAASSQPKVIGKLSAAASAAERTDSEEDGEAVSTEDITDDELKEFEDDTNG